MNDWMRQRFIQQMRYARWTYEYGHLKTAYDEMDEIVTSYFKLEKDSVKTPVKADLRKRAKERADAGKARPTPEPPPAKEKGQRDGRVGAHRYHC